LGEVFRLQDVDELEEAERRYLPKGLGLAAGIRAEPAATDTWETHDD